MVLFDNLEYLIIGHVSGLVGAALEKFGCSVNTTFHGHPAALQMKCHNTRTAVYVFLLCVLYKEHKIH
jgi:hypothetical protein